MALTLHFHPLSSFCQKALIGLYELGVPFEKHFVDLGNPEHRAEFLKLWLLGKFPVLRDDLSRRTVPESTIILEYLDQRHTPGHRLIPADADRALHCRLQDRLYDLYVNMPVGKIVTDKLRPGGQNDPLGVEHARSQLCTAYAIADAQLETSRWASGDEFGLADCAAAPALFFANKIIPFESTHPRLAAYFARVATRPSVARTLDEAAPYLSLFPG